MWTTWATASSRLAIETDAARRAGQTTRITTCRKLGPHGQVFQSAILLKIEQERRHFCGGWIASLNPIDRPNNFLNCLHTFSLNVFQFAKTWPGVCVKLKDLPYCAVKTC
jgi:hypothetical protein